MKALDQWYDIGVKDQVLKHLISSLLFKTPTPLTFVNGGCSYFAQRLLIVCSLQQSFLFTNITFESKFRVKYTIYLFERL